ncbi:ATP-binding protein [Mesorhizobium sp. KR1-2]|uniref:AAA family ATPase n=1 Tax=Mesorhizobium sp. KR1-2 TaxID=3156609 RepID=UPI0032B4075B
MKPDLRGFAFASRLSENGRNTSAFASLEEELPISSIPQKKRPPQKEPKAAPQKEPAQPQLASLRRRNSNGSELFHFVEPQHHASDIVLDAENYRLLSEIAEEFRRGDDLRRFGLKPRSKLLFCGPPGCGKTLCAEVLAYELKLPLLVARLDGIITTFLGETASNLRQLFDVAASVRSVLFLDEFDALARTRMDGNEHSEIRRVVNSLLTLIEDFKGRGLLIAATNLQSSIDAAAWRRFDEVVLFKYPTRTQILRLIRAKTKNFTAEVDFSDFIDDLAGMSFAEVERICLAAIKREIVHGNSTLGRQAFASAVRDEKRRIAIRTKIRGDDTP